MEGSGADRVEAEGEEEPESEAEDMEPSAGAGDQASSSGGSKRAARRKINVQLISNERHRAVTFAKRKGGLIKKAAELSILCDAEVAVLVACKNQKMTIFSSSPFEQVIKKYHSSRDWREITTTDIYPYMDQDGNASCDANPQASEGSAYSAATRAARTGGQVVFACPSPAAPSFAAYQPGVPTVAGATPYVFPGGGAALSPVGVPLLPYATVPSYHPPHCGAFPAASVAGSGDVGGDPGSSERLLVRDANGLPPGAAHLAGLPPGAAPPPGVPPPPVTSAAAMQAHASAHLAATRGGKSLRRPCLGAAAPIESFGCGRRSRTRLDVRLLLRPALRPSRPRRGALVGAPSQAPCGAARTAPPFATSPRPRPSRSTTSPPATRCCRRTPRSRRPRPRSSSTTRRSRRGWPRPAPTPKPCRLPVWPQCRLKHASACKAVRLWLCS